MSSPSPRRPRRRTILVTGFGGFPGAPRNPTEAIVARLRREAPRFERMGVRLCCLVLPVRYGALQPRLDALLRDLQPDAVLHLGVAGRRRRLCVETLARNRAAPLRRDAEGACPPPVVLAGAAGTLRATFPDRRILAALRTAGLPTVLSRDAGDYVCNAVLFRSLAMALAPAVGFLHVPAARRPGTRRRTPTSPRRLAPGDLARAALLAALSLAPRGTARPSPYDQEAPPRPEP